ncbi:MAG: phage shock protein PspA [Alphaproteobacteria bacterium]|nr:phage shock protein PspA [Alphaproteobacteria bacterium]TAD89253.1 MAG: phage shock protein PspA [Alphaproteobacteria bacterium]
MGIFSRLADIVSSNVNALLDRAEDPEKLIRLIIQEMEDTLVEVRSSAVKTIAEKKELERRITGLDAEVTEWQRRAELALTRDREDLAKAALIQKAQLVEDRAGLAVQLQQLDDVLTKNAEDVAALEAKLAEARSRQQTLVARHQSAVHRARVREQLHDRRLTEAFQRMDQMERVLDLAESRVDAMDLGRKRSLKDEFVELEATSAVERELADLKARMVKS